MRMVKRIFAIEAVGGDLLDSVKCMISLGQFYVKCSLSAEGTGIWEKSVLFLSRNKKVML